MPMAALVAAPIWWTLVLALLVGGRALVGATSCDTTCQNKPLWQCSLPPTCSYLYVLASRRCFPLVYSAAYALLCCPVSAHACTCRSCVCRSLDGSQLSGSLPSSLGSLAWLRTLYVVVLLVSA
jgi:hypothetical protein